MTELITLQFQAFDVRFIDGKAVANDVATVLGYADPASTISKKVFEQNRSVAKMETLDGKQRDVTVLEEAGIYQLIFSSKLETAKEFQQWVFEEVLPSIRKTGSYSAKPLSLVELHLQAAQILVDHEKQLTEHQQVLEKQDSRLNTIEQRFQKADEVLKQLPPATTEVPTKSVRSCVNEVLRSYSYRTGDAYQSLWNVLYKEYKIAIMLT
jgi:prophage antirepressor-like protein